MTKLESKLRTEQDSQDLIRERDYLANILQWVATQNRQTEAALQVMIQNYNNLVQSHVAKRDKEKPSDGSSSA